mmetsp:Transcript_23299/g.28628  ORF Transcript_23299/g.28628 Transcript_23299/m.28628 type:complete len:113 (+) Transcript_23299:157-495(+)
MNNFTSSPPKRWIRLRQMLEKEDYVLERISGSHHIFSKPGRRCIPVAFHGGTISQKYAVMVLKQAGIGRPQGNEIPINKKGHGCEIKESQKLSPSTYPFRDDGLHVWSASHF